MLLTAWSNFDQKLVLHRNLILDPDVYHLLHFSFDEDLHAPV